MQTVSTWDIKNKRTAARSELNIQVLVNAVDWAIDEFNKSKTDHGDNWGGSWNQGTWFRGKPTKRALRDEHGRARTQVSVSCGSSFCVAGNICASAGDRFVVGGEPEAWKDFDTIGVDHVMPVGSKQLIFIEQRATELLGASDHDDNLGSLFGGDNDIQEVVEIATAIAKTHGYKVTWRPIRGLE